MGWAGVDHSQSLFLISSWGISQPSRLGYRAGDSPGLPPTRSLCKERQEIRMEHGILILDGNWNFQCNLLRRVWMPKRKENLTRRSRHNDDVNCEDLYEAFSLYQYDSTSMTRPQYRTSTRTWIRRDKGCGIQDNAFQCLLLLRVITIGLNILNSAAYDF